MKTNELNEMKTVPNFPRYKISKSAMIYDTKLKRELKPHFHGVERRNYHQVSLMKDGKRHTHRVHSIMAWTYLDHKCSHKLVVDHIDNDPLNNNLDNLQIITQKENVNKDRLIRRKKQIEEWNKEKIKNKFGISIKD